LKRDKDTNGIIAERKENTNWEGWQMEEILGEIMDVDNCYTSEQLKKEMDEFDEAVSDDKVEQAEAIYKKLINAVNPNGTIAQMLNAQIRELRNYHEAY
jgi:F0F1-type ATP synthase gamma subunit